MLTKLRAKASPLRAEINHQEEQVSCKIPERVSGQEDVTVTIIEGASLPETREREYKNKHEIDQKLRKTI